MFSQAGETPWRTKAGGNIWRKKSQVKEQPVSRDFSSTLMDL
jgi:hypothetical protein